MSEPVLTFHWQGTSFAVDLNPIERSDELVAAVDIIAPTGRVVGDASIIVEVPLADLIVMGRAAQGALEAFRTRPKPGPSGYSEWTPP